MRIRALLLTIAMANLAAAADSEHFNTDPIARCCEARRCCTCPDTYCPKPLPCVPCAARLLRQLLSEANALHGSAALLRSERLLSEAVLLLFTAVLAGLV